MLSKITSRFLLPLALTAALVATMMVAAPAPAHADRCEPEELVTGPGTSPIDERDHPLCYALINYVYPFVCTDYSTLVNCVGSLQLNLGYRPGVAPYQPDPGRIVCNAVNYVGFGCTTIPAPDVR